MQKIIVMDTDFLLRCAAEKIDIKREIQRICDYPHTLAIVDKTEQEIKGKPKEKMVMSMLELLQPKRIESINKDVDDSILKTKKEWWVATQDKELKRKLKGKAGIITLRKRKRIVVINP